MEAITITNNEENLRFEAPVGDDLAYVEYRWHKGVIFLMHTYVPDGGRGKGYSSALAKHVLEFARMRHLKIRVYCPYIAQFIKHHPEYETLIDNSHE